MPIRQKVFGNLDQSYIYLTDNFPKMWQCLYYCCFFLVLSFYSHKDFESL